MATIDAAEMDRVYEGIQERLQRESITPFPRLPATYKMASWPEVEWPNDDWGAFIDVALSTGCRLFYVGHDEIDAEDLNEMTEELRASEYVADEDDDLGPAIEEARKHLGHPCRIELAFAYSGILHRWIGEVAWLWPIDEWLADNADDGGALREAERETARAAQTAEVDRLAPQAEAWVALLSEDPEYLSAPNEEVRRTIAGRLVPELREWTSKGVGFNAADPEERARLHVAYDALSRANYEQSQVKIRRADEAKQNAEAWAADLRDDEAFRAATTVEQRRRRAGEFVAARLGFVSADVRERVLSMVKKSTRKDQQGELL